jgi:hypothetical protein
LEEIRRRTEERFAASLPLEMLEQFVARLGSLGLLAGSAPETALRPGCSERHSSHMAAKANVRKLRREFITFSSSVPVCV